MESFMMKQYLGSAMLTLASLVAPLMGQATDDETNTINLKNLHTRGSGDIIAVTFMDLECIYCKKLHNAMKKVLEIYDGKLVWGYKNFPLTSIHPNAKRESLASECAAEQNRLYPFINKLFHKTTFTNNLTDRKLVRFATAVGIEPKEFRSCLKSREYLKKVNRDITEGERLDIVGVPTTFIVDSNGTILDQIQGAVSQDTIEDVLEQYID